MRSYRKNQNKYKSKYTCLYFSKLTYKLLISHFLLLSVKISHFNLLAGNQFIRERRNTPMVRKLRYISRLQHSNGS